MKKTWMPTTAGALTITSGLFGLLIACGMALASMFAGDAMGWAGASPWTPINFQILIGWMAAPLIMVSVLAIIGGIFALQRRAWGLALAGSIAALVIPCYLLGLGSIIMVSLSKNEFGTNHGTTAHQTLPKPV
jgi:hypothetical protein